ncbi:putative glycoside hydrolase [Marispirochaeta aestuarii]|uniref:putative glycoside hydrolase n=1 Tax=Marispirochaeta aestuarii TaxID=1963862 RepID=UPI0029C915F9|nr:putative glycoside hydrolase [Marispirochaeta aestuarii]
MLRSRSIFPAAVFLALFFFVFSADVNAEKGGYIERGVPVGDSGWYTLIREGGLNFFDTLSGDMSPLSQGLPRRVVYPFSDDKPKDLSAVSIDPVNSRRLAVTTNARLFLSDDRGKSFREIPLNEPIASTNYLTSVALGRDKHIYLGTSFNGFFRSTDGGKSWTKLSESLPEIYRGAGFYEEISGIAVDKAGRIAVGTSFSSRIYLAESDLQAWESVRFPYTDEIKGLWFAHPAGLQACELDSVNQVLQVWGTKAIYSYDAGMWTKTPLPVENTLPEPDPDAETRRNRAAEKYGIYINPANASGDKLTALLDFLVQNGMNAVTVDVKDDFGWISYDSNLETVKNTGALRPRFKLDELIAACHARDVYVVGRMVVFKDKQLYEYREHRYAIWDSSRNAPWGHFVPEKNEEDETVYRQREFWVDPFSQDVWEYNLAIAEELQARGVDEIQFDYIRFPSDGNLSTARYRHRHDGMSRIEALESFLIMVREKISVPISTDLYGFNSWYRMGNWIGQNIELVSHYVDVICPMYYPSHFPRSFMKDLPYLERAERIYQEGSSRSARIADGRSIIRPYVQAFLLPFEYYMEEPEYSEYLERQLRGTKNSPASGFTLWNNSNRYYMVTRPLYPFLSLQGEAVLGDREQAEVPEILE